MELSDLQDTAALARLNLSGDALQKIFPAFGEMVSFFAVMQDADADSTLPAAKEQVDGMAASVQSVAAGHLRPDLAPGEAQDSESLLSQAGERDGRFFVIPNVL